MTSRHIKHFCRCNWLLISVFALTSAVVLWFGLKMLTGFLYYNDKEHHDAALKGWMTPRYVVMMYDLPRGLVRDTLQLTGPDARGRPLRRIAADMGLSMEEMTELIREVAKQHREASQ